MKAVRGDAVVGATVLDLGLHTMSVQTKDGRILEIWAEPSQTGIQLTVYETSQAKENKQ